MRKLIPLIVILSALLFSETNTNIAPTVKLEKMATAIASDTQFSPQSSTIFTFLGLAPSSIQRPSLIRDFKFDGGITGAGKISMGFETQPIWLLACRRMSFDTYSHIPGFFRNLINTSVSIGVRQQDSYNSIGYAFKIPVFFKDPMADKKYNQQLNFAMSSTEEDLIKEIQLLDYYLAKNMFVSMSKKDMVEKRAVLNRELEKDDSVIKAKAIQYKEQYQASNWNAAQLNVYFAQGFDLTVTDPMVLYKQYLSAWIIANQPIGKVGTLNEIGRVYYETVSSNSTNLFFTYGINLTVGTPKATFFIEGLVSATTNDAFSNVLCNFGGNFKPSEKISFDVGLRMAFNKTMNLINLTPAFNVSLRL
jgi:hypothetical protein